MELRYREARTPARKVWFAFGGAADRLAAPLRRGFAMLRALRDEAGWTV